MPVKAPIKKRSHYKTVFSLACYTQTCPSITTTYPFMLSFFPSEPYHVTPNRDCQQRWLLCLSSVLEVPYK